MAASIQIVPCFSLEPNKLALFNRVFRPQKVDTVNENIFVKPLKVVDPIQLDFFQNALPLEPAFETVKNVWLENRSRQRVSRSHHNFTISDNAYRTLKRKINWLYYLSKTKDITTYSGKRVFNFRLSFITLTLPAAQKTDTKTITNELFNQFLTELRQRVQLTNYVWRLEFQKNKNVHYHLVSDVYVDYFLCLKIWNRILEQHGYISDYHNKFAGLSLAAYNKTVNSADKIDFNTIAKRYAFGCKHNWSQPNTVDVKSVTNQKKISNYIAKYFGKNDTGKSLCNDLDTLENSANLRLWFCSRSLSKLNSITDFCEASVVDLFAVVSDIAGVRRVFTKWCNLLYFDFKNCVQATNVLLHKMLKSYAFGLGYSPS